MKRYASLRWKLIWLITGGSVVAAAIAAAGFSWFDLQRYWQHTNSEVSAIAAVVGDQAGLAITLGDKHEATEILKSLAADVLVESAVLYDTKGRCFAWYFRSGTNGCPLQPSDGFRRVQESLVFAHPLLMQGDRLGTLVIAARVTSVAAVLGQYLRSAGLIFLLSLAVAAVLAMALQSTVSTPILAIARVAQRIAQTHRFTDRVIVSSTDELGVLAESFNSMLEEIERRDAQLARNQQSLENQVEERNRVNRELRLAKERAESAALLKSRFLANMSHEIRTPMNGVVGMLSLVLDRCTDSEEREQLEVAQMAAQSLVRLLNDILDLSKVEAGKLTVETIDFDLRLTVQESLRMFEIPACEKHLELKMESDPEIPRRVRGDPVRLRQVLINLIGNAVKFTPGGSVRIEVRPALRGTIRFDVQDTGIGIAADKCDEIFEAFTQGDGSHTRRFGGTGLGLTITRGLVHLMGGTIGVESSQGHGSRFYFELPLPAAASPESPNCSPANPLQLPTLNVLVAEDNPINQRVVEAMLHRQGWRVTLAVDGRQACEFAAKAPYDIILMDIQMPEMDGLEATHHIRQSGPVDRRRTPILALTAHASEAQSEQCKAAGMDGVVTKPVNLPALLRAIAEALAATRPSASP